MKLSKDEKQAAFSLAVQRLGLSPSDAGAVFGVSRQTFYRWATGAVRVPDWVFFQIVGHENKSWSMLREREEEIKDLVSRLNGGAGAAK